MRFADTKAYMALLVVATFIGCYCLLQLLLSTQP